MVEYKLQSHMLNGLSELFDLDYKEMQIQLLNQRIDEHFGNEPFFNEAINKLAKTNKSNKNNVKNNPNKTKWFS